MTETLCSKCQNEPRIPGQRWGRVCRAAYMRGWRKSEAGLACTERDRPRNGVRAKARHAVATGVLTPQPCEICGAEPAEKHHENYAKPLVVEWLCKRCHCALHRLERQWRQRLIEIVRRETIGAERFHES